MNNIKSKPRAIYGLKVPIQHKGPQAHLGHKLQSYNAAHDSNPFVRSYALSLLRPWAQDPCHYAQPKARWPCDLELYTSRFIVKDLPSQHILTENVIARGCYVSVAQYCPRKYRCRTSPLRWELVPKPLLPLLAKHPLKGNGIGPPCPLTIKKNHNPSTNLEL